MIDLLRNADVLLFCCEVSSDAIDSRWVQIDPSKIDSILGTQQVVKVPKTVDAIEYTITIPADIGAVHTDVRFPLISVAS